MNKKPFAKEPFAFVAVACLSAFITGISLVLWQASRFDGYAPMQDVSAVGLNEHFGGADAGCLYGKIMMNRESLRLADKRIHPAFLRAVSVLEQPSSDIRTMIASIGEYNFAVMDWEVQLQTLYLRVGYLKFLLDSKQWLPAYMDRRELYDLCKGTMGIMDGETAEHLQESNTVWAFYLQYGLHLRPQPGRGRVLVIASLVIRPGRLFLA